MRISPGVGQGVIAAAWREYRECCHLTFLHGFHCLAMRYLHSNSDDTNILKAKENLDKILVREIRERSKSKRLERKIR